jgi:hypothetical protein
MEIILYTSPSREIKSGFLGGHRPDSLLLTYLPINAEIIIYITYEYLREVRRCAILLLATHESVSV